MINGYLTIQALMGIKDVVVTIRCHGFYLFTIHRRSSINEQDRVNC